MLRWLIYNIAIFVYKEEFSLLKEKVNSIISNSPEIAYNSLLVNLLISAEDHRFRYHPIGFDVIAIARAFRNNLIFRKREGASTIEQQLVRVLTGNFERTLSRKIKELLLATTLPLVIERRRIPAAYLYCAYYGTYMNGLKELQQKLQIGDINEIPIEKAAEIISRIKYPEPKNSNEKFLIKLEQRKRHLIWLYKKHYSRKLFRIYG